MARSITQATPDKIREFSPEDLRSYVQAAAPLHNDLMNQAEELMTQARPLNEGLYIARTRLAEMGEPLE